MLIDDGGRRSLVAVGLLLGAPLLIGALALDGEFFSRCSDERRRELLALLGVDPNLPGPARWDVAPDVAPTSSRRHPGVPPGDLLDRILTTLRFSPFRP